MVEPLAIIGAAAAVYTILKPRAASADEVKKIVQEIVQEVPPEQRAALAEDPEAVKVLVEARTLELWREASDQPELTYADELELQEWLKERGLPAYVPTKSG